MACLRFNDAVTTLLESHDAPWALFFKIDYDSKHPKKEAQYWFKPQAALAGRIKRDHDHAKKWDITRTSMWGQRFKNVKVYHTLSNDSDQDEEFFFLFVGNKSTLEKIKHEFMQQNKNDAEFTEHEDFSQSLKPETQKHLGDIMDHL